MTTTVQARESVYQRWATQWGSTTPYKFENEQSDGLDSGQIAWARVAVREAAGGQQTLGPTGVRKFRRRGIVFVQLFTPLDRGMTAAGTLAQQARAVFEASSVDELDFYDGQIRDSGPSGRWHLTLVTVSFNFYETK